jgi:hypothetical protein
MLNEQEEGEEVANASGKKTRELKGRSLDTVCLYSCALSFVCGSCLAFSLANMSTSMSTSMYMTSQNHPAMNALIRLSFYLSLLSLFHILEFYSTAISHPTTVTVKAFLLDHSKGYKMAFAAAIVEHLLESVVFGFHFKRHAIGIFDIIGIFLSLHSFRFSSLYLSYLSLPESSPSLSLYLSSLFSIPLYSTAVN